jgi:phage pi2 protein 07
MQNLDVQLSITIPSNLVLIERVEYQRLQEQELNGQWWSMKDLEARTAKKVDWIKENILYVPRFKKLLDVQSGGFVYYPQTRGENWAFQAPQMANFLDKHFSNIYNK